MSENPQTTAVFSKEFMRLWLLLLVLVSVLIRLHGADYYYYSSDEAVVLNMAEGRTLGEVWQFSHYEAPAPLGNMLRHFWVAISDDPTFARTESLLFGVALIVLYYRIGLLLGGELCGMACALLIAFSHGCIIQSFAVRNYCFFVFFLSCAFYCYLRWRESRSAGALLGYTLWGCIASLVNFTTVLAVLCMGAIETVWLWREKASPRTFMKWFIANGIAAFAAGIIYVLWMPLLVPLKSYLVQYLVTPQTVISRTLLYPMAQAEYIYPNPLFAIILLACTAAFAFRWWNKEPSASFYPMLALALLAFVLGMALLATNIYPYFGTRRGLWILPFLIAPVGMMLASMCANPASAASPRTPRIASLGVIFVGCLLYSSTDRFHDGAEYVMPQNEWDSAQDTLKTLTPSDLIVIERDDGALLANLYRYTGDDAFSGKTMATLAPYNNLQILFNPYYPRSYSTAVFLANLEEARNKGWLKPPGNILFFRTAWSRSPVTDLMLCSELQKTVLTFPALPAGESLTRHVIYGSYISMMRVPKETLLEDVLAPSGKARKCLDGKNDMVPGFKPGG